MQSLVFFNKEGDNLNFRYNQDDERWEGDLIFHENSDDTHKTVGLYVFEKIPAFEYEKPGDMQLEKFQLFNEYGINISGNQYFTQSVKKVEIANNDPNFYSKWIYGENFEKLFPKGSQIRFNTPFLEFSNPNRPYIVIKTKKNAIMIMSDLDNRKFYQDYGASLENPLTYLYQINSVTQSFSISGVNSIGVYNYIKNDLTDNLSSWSEPGFYDKYFVGRVLNLIGTDKNDGVYSIKNINIHDKIYTRYLLDAQYITQSYSLLVDMTLKTDLPVVYTGGLGLTAGKVTFSGKIPKILKPGREFTLPSSLVNTGVFKIGPIREFTKINKLTYFQEQDQVIYNSNIYECIQAYTWSGTSLILPDDTDYWSSPTYLPILSDITFEYFESTEVQLTTNRFTFSQAFTQSFLTTLGSSVERYSSDFDVFDIYYYLDNKKLYADLKYPSYYADLKFLISLTSSYQDVTQRIRINEKNVEIEEVLKPENNRNFSSNFAYNIVFTDIDEFGIRLTINDQVYYEDVVFLYDGLDVNLDRTIDKTLRNWYTKWYLQLALTGVIPKLKFTGKDYSFYLNTIQLTTEYPNVPLEFRAEVGTTANFYIQRTNVIFNQIGSYMSVIINDRTYGQVAVMSNGVVDIAATLENWVDDWGIVLEGYGIYVTNLLSMLAFDVKEQDTRFEISVNANIASLPGLPAYTIENLFRGNRGSFVTSNAIVLTGPTYSFEEEAFATGQLVAVNNSLRAWNNQEYNIEYLDPKIINLSYQGPFWSTKDPACDASPFITIALSNGFGATGCTIAPPIPTNFGEFNQDYSNSFSVDFGNKNTYILNADFEIEETDAFVDLFYLGISNRIYVFGKKISIIDSVTAKVIDEIKLPGSGRGISMHFNEYNNYIYCLSENETETGGVLHLIDPLYPRLDYIIELDTIPLNCGINPDTGDVYISYGTGVVDIWNSSNFTTQSTTQLTSTDYNYYRFAYNKSENDMYVTADDYVFRINGSTRTIQQEFYIPQVKTDIFYEPQRSSMYVFDTNDMININGGTFSGLTALSQYITLTSWLPQISPTTSNLNKVVFNTDKLGIAVGDGGVLLRTINGGENWNRVTASTTQNITAAFSFKDEGYMYYGGAGGVVKFSNDLGLTWENFSTQPTSTNINDIRFRTEDWGVILQNNGRFEIWNGTTWASKNLSTFTTANLNSIWANSDFSVMFIVGNSNTILKTGYNASTNPTLNNWTNLSNNQRSYLFSSSTTANGTIVVGEGGIILRSSDSTNWFTSFANTTATHSSVHFPTSSVGYLVSQTGRIQKSSNSGSSWSQQTSPTTRNLNSVHFFNEDYGIACGDAGTVLWTENGGGIWNTHRDPFGSDWTINKLNAVYFVNHTTSGSTKVAVGNGGVILQSPATKYRGILSVDSLTTSGILEPGTYTGVTQDSTSGSGTGASFNITIGVTGLLQSVTIVNRGINYFSNNTITINNTQLGNGLNGISVSFRIATTISLWDNVSVSGVTQNLNGVWFTNTSNGYIVGNGGVVLRTINSGASWQTHLNLTHNLLSIYFFGGNGWISGAGGRIWRSTDGGGTFPPLSTSGLGSDDITSISFSDNQNGTCTDSKGHIYKTSNSGSTWTKVTFDFNSVNFVDDNTGWIAGKNGIVLKTTDSGLTWKYQHTGTTQSINTVKFIDTNVGYIVGVGGMIRKNTVGGRSGSWTNQNSGTSNIKSLEFTDNSTAYAVGDAGIIYKTEKDPPLVRNLAFNNIKEEMILSTPGGILNFDLDGKFINFGQTPTFGPIVVNQFDGDIYLASQFNSILFVYDANTYNFKHAQFFREGKVKKIIYNPDRQSIFGIVPNTVIEQQTLFELQVQIGSQIVVESQTYSVVGENNYGTLAPNYVPHPDLWLKTREYIRYPRENYNDEPNVQFIWDWEDDQITDIFLYDFSGNQLTTTGPLAYTGPKPLPIATLNKKANTKIDRVSLSEYQQTVFDQMVFTLDRVDVPTDYFTKPTPMEIFIGINSENEGVVSSNLLLYKREFVSFTISANSTNNDVLYFAISSNEQFGLHTMIMFNTNSYSNFRQDENGRTRGLKAGQIIKITIEDNVNKKNKYYSKNNGATARILAVYSKYLLVEGVDRIIFDEFSQIDNFPRQSDITYLTVKFEVIDKLIGQFSIKSQTEIEDVRYKIELSNTGHLIDPYDTFIFKSYDINEQGIDWNFLNKKRKEMLMVRNEIFSYIGSYKAIINAINFFGYNDLELYEYYRDINPESTDFGKLFKVEIPDIFDSTVPGWNDSDFLKHTFPNENYEDTNLFNLTYNITDKEGTNVLLYSLAEVILKLQGLKIWLEKKVIPITHRILDITGRADFVGNTSIQHKSYDTKILNIRQSMTPVDFNLSESYLMPINSGSTVYTCHIDFTMSPSPTASQIPDYFTVRIRTYKTYKEWKPFTNYMIGDRVIYFGVIYESVIDNNKIKNPRKYTTVSNWSPTVDYSLGQYSNYKKEIYQYIGMTSSFNIFGTVSTFTPASDIINNGATASWLIMTEWKEIELTPVQNLYEWRTIGTFSESQFLPPQPTEAIKVSNPYNFTVDTNIDPFIVIEVTSDNGYGQIYTTKKNYEIRGLNDLNDPIQYIEAIGPFQPISRTYPYVTD